MNWCHLLRSQNLHLTCTFSIKCAETCNPYPLWLRSGCLDSRYWLLVSEQTIHLQAVGPLVGTLRPTGWATSNRFSRSSWSLRISFVTTFRAGSVPPCAAYSDANGQNDDHN